MSVRPAAHRAGREGLHGAERRPLLLPRHGEGQPERLLLLRRLPQDTHHRSEERHVGHRQDKYVSPRRLHPLRMMQHFDLLSDHFSDVHIHTSKAI